LGENKLFDEKIKANQANILTLESHIGATYVLKLTPKDVVPVLKKHMLVDGFDELVLDLQKSQGNYIYDALNERRYLDLFGFFATSPIGHNHPALQTPEFREKLMSVAVMKPSNSDFYTTEMAEFVQTFAEHAVPKERALAVENALKAAFDWKVRKNFEKGYNEEKGAQIIHFKQAFHGRSGYTLSLTNTADPRKTKYFPKFKWPRVTNPKMTFPMNDANIEKVAALERQAIGEIKDAIQQNSDDIAAIIIEPVQGEGGDNHFRKEFLQALRDIADENDILLIFDEVQTGIGLTGKMWCFEHFDVTPDLLAFGKKTQVCGFLAGKRLDEVENNVFHESSRINSTWGGNLVDMVRFRKYLDVIATEKLVANAHEVGRYFLGELQKLTDEFDGQITNVRGRGLMLAFDLPDGEQRSRFLSQAFTEGMIALGCGERSVRFRPALNLTRNTVDEAIGLTRQSLQRVFAGGSTRIEDDARYEL